VHYFAHLDGEALGEISLPMPGRHLGLNSAAAVLTALRLGLPMRQIADALAAFGSPATLRSSRGVADGVRVSDEYAYHPDG
jgi:UDP-N-acetylmuramate--alanine ligase